MPMRPITLLQPPRIAFGCGVAAQAADDLAAAEARRAFLVTSPPLGEIVAPVVRALEGAGIAVTVYSEVATEPTVTSFGQALAAARAVRPDAVLGVGGGSALDVAKLVAALHGAGRARGLCIGLLRGRRTRLLCLPTTAGTGSRSRRTPSSSTRRTP